MWKWTKERTKGSDRKKNQNSRQSIFSIMHLGVAIWKDKYNCNYDRARHLDLPRLPSLNLWRGGGKKSNVSIQLISNHLQIQLCDPQVKPLCLHLTSKKTNTPQFRSVQTPEYKCVKGGGWQRWRNAHIKMEQSKSPNKTQAAPEQYECLLVESFISFVFISPLLSLSRCYLCSRYRAMHWGCVELIRTVIDGRVDDLSFRLNTRLDICLLAAFACFPPVYGNLSPYSLCHWEDTV